MRFRYELLEKIIVYLYRNGFKTTKMTDLSDDLDVTIAVLYKEFGNKQEMIEACFYHMMKVYDRKTAEICMESKDPAEMFFRFKNEVLFNISMVDQRRSWNELRTSFHKLYNRELPVQLQQLILCFESLYGEAKKKDFLREGVDIPMAAKASAFSYFEVLNSPIYDEIEKNFEKVAQWYYDLIVRGCLNTEGILAYNQYNKNQ
ncbi:MAG: TetR/AcrR family transcriptional regulator [Weeksellaceae bacterium]|nr:TetR/AcrR family transcriptional regulator [Weeksellaceae bacterium]